MFACVALAALAVMFHMISSAAGAQATPQVVRSNATGRWTIVNGTPGFAQNIMLLDTATGDSWVKCQNSEGVSMWCVVARTDYQPGKSEGTSDK
jgi:hypothetical protein